MGRRFAELAFTPLVKEQQERHGSRHLYERVEQSLDFGDRLGEPSRPLSANAMAFTWLLLRKLAGLMFSIEAGLLGFFAFWTSGRLVSRI